MTQTRAQRRFVRLASSMNKKASGLGRNGRVTPEDLARLYIASIGMCHYCFITITPEDCSFDHVLPFDAGGDNTVENLVACCLTDQRSKARRLTHEYAEARAHVATCEVCAKRFKPRWADVRRGYGTTCSASCAGKKGRQVRSAIFAAR